MKNKQILIALFLLIFIISACQMGDSTYMSKSQKEEMEHAFDSMQISFDNMMQSYQQDSSDFPGEIKELYDGIQSMHQNMAVNHNHMMTNHNNGEDQRMRGRQMYIDIQNRISGEWYNQMEAMHKQMAHLHKETGHKDLANQNRQLAEKFNQLDNLVPKSEKTVTQKVNPKGDPKLLNGQKLYSQNCTSCHGSNGQGIANSFPPLLDTKWITGDKSIPIRIIKDGLNGSITVDGRTYEGIMPAFKARLSVAEMAAIANYLRDQSSDNYQHITQEDVIDITNTYNNRNSPWKGDELLGRE